MKYTVFTLHGIIHTVSALKSNYIIIYFLNIPMYGNDILKKQKLEMNFQVPIQIRVLF